MASQHFMLQQMKQNKRMWYFLVKPYWFRFNFGAAIVGRVRAVARGGGGALMGVKVLITLGQLLWTKYLRAYNL